MKEKPESQVSDPEAISSWSSSFRLACAYCYVTVTLQSGRAGAIRTVWPAFPFGVYLVT